MASLKKLKYYKPVNVNANEVFHHHNGFKILTLGHYFKLESIYKLEVGKNGLKSYKHRFVPLGSNFLLDLGQQDSTTLNLRSANGSSASPKQVDSVGMPWGIGGCSYGDFIIRVLPLINEIIETFAASGENDAYLHLPYMRRAKWCDPFVSLLGFPLDRLLADDADFIAIPDGRLYFTSGARSASFVAHPEQLLRLREKVLSSVGKMDHERHPRIYISRDKGRRMLNENELIPGLRDRGFQILRLEDYSVREQIHLFAHAEIVVGPHGAGHANILWSRPGTKLFEVFHPAWKHPCYSILSSLVGIEYHYMMSGAACCRGSINRFSRSGISQNVFAPSHDFFKVVDKLIS
jgi:capsular polysaccharide biosynthesis protein